jgi:ion channel
MLLMLFVAWGLMALCVVIHAGGVTYIVRWLGRQLEGRSTFTYGMWLFVRIAGWIIVLHLLEIALWGVVYAYTGAMPGLKDALYFSTVTYTTTGYGDLVLPAEWRFAGGIEALTGILMCGLSTAFFFAAVSNIHQSHATDR